MNIIVITNLSRPDLLKQTLDSLEGNATDWKAHHLTLVVDGAHPKSYGTMMEDTLYGYSVPANAIVKLRDRHGASASRNIGAGSIPKNRRQECVMFCDDDIYAAPKWDDSLMSLHMVKPLAIISGYSHPFNQCEPKQIDSGSIHFQYGEPLVISSVAMMMPWLMFDDDIGPWDEPGGAGASEDYALCMRARDRGFGFAVTYPQVILHTGLMSSTGGKIVGYDELAKQNDELLDLHGIRGKVVFG